MRGDGGENAERAADHHADQAVDAGLSHRHRADELAVAQHRGAVADRHHFVEPVGDVDDADAVSFKGPHEVEQAGDLGRRERRRRLVHDDEAGVDRQRPGDLDHLLVGDREIAHQPARVHLQAEPVERALGLAHRRRPVDEAAAPRFAADHHVLGDAERRDEVEFLVDGDDALRLRLVRRRKRHRRAVEDDFAGVGALRARQDLQQGRFAGAVFAEQRMDLARPHLERDLVERDDAGEALGDPSHAEERRGVRHRRSGLKL